MDPNQMFIIEVLKLVIPVVSTVVTIVGGVILFRQQQAVKKSADNAAVKSERAEQAANHSKAVVASMQENFQAVVRIMAPGVASKVDAAIPPAGATDGEPPAPLEVIVVNTDPVPVIEKGEGKPTYKPGSGP